MGHGQDAEPVLTQGIRRASGKELECPGTLENSEAYFYINGNGAGYSTVTDLARLRGWSTSQPRRTAMWYASNWRGMISNSGTSSSGAGGSSMIWSEASRAR